MDKETSKFVWIKNGNTYSQVENNLEILDSELPRGVYKPIMTLTGCKLQCIDDEFKFSFKVYDLEDKFIQHVMKTWNATDKNLGILLNGTKGSGKTQTGKLLANATGLPIILVDTDDGGIVDFIKGFDFPCVLFFDEYEKVFEESGGILTLMDGMYSDLNRKMFILTTNEKLINRNLLSRPSRVRYFREFTNIPLDMMVAYIKDNLVNKDRIEEIIKFIDKLEISTIDIVKAIVEEVNLHDCSTDDILDFMNLSKKNIRINCIYCYENHTTNDLKEFKEKVARLFKPGKDDAGNEKEYLLPRHVNLHEGKFFFYKSPSELQPGDTVNDNDEWEIISIDKDENGEGYFMKTLRYGDETLFFYIESDTESSSIYGEDLLRYTF